VQVSAAPGVYNFGNFLIVHADSRTGEFASVQVTGDLGNRVRNPHLTYVGGDVFLTLDPNLLSILLPPNANENQRNVAGGIDKAINAGANLGPFANLFLLTPQGIANAMTQLSGEGATGLWLANFQSMSAFLNLMLDPFVDQRAAGVGGAALAFGPEAEQLPAEVANAYAAFMPVKAQPAGASAAMRWSFWGSGYGGYQKTAGDVAVVGSHDVTARAYGFAAGADYRFSARTVLGFALAGGGTSWGLADGLGGGRSDSFKLGAYASTRWGMGGYVSGALAYAHHWVTTDRTTSALGSEKLTADFKANGLGLRLESGYRIAMPFVGVTPYGALQAMSLSAPAYTETATFGAGASALSFNARNASTTRTELGAWFDHTSRLGDGNVLALRARAAWAHNWFSDPTLTAAFPTLPGASFIVNGATPARDAGLFSGRAEYRTRNNVAFSLKLDGEFGRGSQTYTGTGTVRVEW
jgi:outer membrane autotransporter protein